MIGVQVYAKVSHLSGMTTISQSEIFNADHTKEIITYL